MTLRAMPPLIFKGQAKGDDPNKEEIPPSSSWGLGREAILTKKNFIVEKPNNGRRKDNIGQ